MHRSRLNQDVDRSVQLRTIAIGDEVRDIEAARGAGIAAGTVTFGYNAAAALRAHGPDLVFDDYTELVTTLTA